MTYQSKMIKGGKMVVPAELRRELGFQDGDSLYVDRDGSKLIVQSRAAMLQEIRRKVKAAIKHPVSVDSYLKEKWAEADSE